MLSARDIMTRHVVFVDPDEPIEHAIDLMLRHGVSGLVVVNSCCELLGVITEFDILDIINDPETERTMVYHFMTRDPKSVDVETSIFELGQIFKRKSVRRYPVLEDGKVVGIVSRRELVRFVHEIRLAAKRRHDHPASCN